MFSVLVVTSTCSCEEMGEQHPQLGIFLKNASAYCQSAPLPVVQPKGGDTHLSMFQKLQIWKKFCPIYIAKPRNEG